MPRCPQKSVVLRQYLLQLHIMKSHLSICINHFILATLISFTFEGFLRGQCHLYLLFVNAASTAKKNSFLIKQFSVH